MKRKWKDTRGETLVEVLASILIGALSAALLFSAVIASVSMDNKAKTAGQIHSAALDAAEKQTTSDSDNVVIINKDIAGSEISVSAKFYGGEGAWSFALSTSPP